MFNGICSNTAQTAALCVLVVAGCQSPNFKAGSLPRELLAPAGGGKQQLQLRGMALAGGTSSAVGPADLLDVSIVTGLDDEGAEPLQVRVGDNGVVEIPYIGPVEVAGVDPTEAAERIKIAAIERGIYRQPQVHISVAEQATYRVTVLGSVSEPGVQEVPRRGCDILGAIAAAGGFTEEAGTVVEVLRHRQEGLAGNDDVMPSSESYSPSGVQPVSFDAPAAPGVSTSSAESFDLANLKALEPNRQRLGDRDVVVVRPREKRVVHVSGLVAHPDQFELTEDHDLRLLDAIAMAGGTTSKVADQAILIRRVQGRPEPVVIDVSLAAAKKAGNENLVLQSGDLISVEPTVATTVVDTFTTLFRISLGLGGNLSLF